ncbi:MAG: hypothetical protein V2A73_06350 [Pseudomonadota bacterium]
MKKLLASLLLAGSVALGVVGCDDDDDENNQDASGRIDGQQVVDARPSADS